MADVCIIGGGAAGSALALRLARKGVTSSVLESGPWYTAADKEERFLGVMEGRLSGNPYRLKEAAIERYHNAGPVNIPLDFERVRAVGGTTLFWLGNSPRMLKNDFRMRSTFGVARDWPIGYDDLEPYYGQAEHEIGVAGVEDNRFAEHRSTPFPMPPIPFSYADKVLKRTTDRLGVEFHHTPQARNSVPYDGRSECLACTLCDVCPSGAKATFDVTHATPAVKTGKVRFITDATVQRIEVDEHGFARRVVYAGTDRVEHALEARVFVVASGGIETPRLLLLSASRGFPDGLANGSGLVGKGLMNHPVAQLTGEIQESVHPYRVGFESTESFQYYASSTRNERAAFLMNLNNYWGCGPKPSEIAARSPLWGDRLAQQIRDEFGRYLSLSAGLEQLPDDRNMVSLDPVHRDFFGQPVPRTHYQFDEYTRTGFKAASEVMRWILDEAGARRLIGPAQWWPGHHLGTTRMGDDPRTSVVDANLRAHDVPNLYLVTTGCFVTGGCANPTLTLTALALRLGEHLAKTRGLAAG